MCDSMHQTHLKSNILMFTEHIFQLISKPFVTRETECTVKVITIFCSSFTELAQLETSKIYSANPLL